MEPVCGGESGGEACGMGEELGVEHASSSRVLGETWVTGRVSVGEGETYRWGPSSSLLRRRRCCKEGCGTGVPSPGRGEECS